jgi:hydrogenase maturation factor
MNLIYGEVVDIFTENEIKFGKVRVGRALKKVPIELLTNVARGDTILLCDGVAISRVQGNKAVKELEMNLSGRRSAFTDH